MCLKHSGKVRNINLFTAKAYKYCYFTSCYCGRQLKGSCKSINNRLFVISLLYFWNGVLYTPVGRLENEKSHLLDRFSDSIVYTALH